VDVLLPKCHFLSWAVLLLRPRQSLHLLDTVQPYCSWSWHASANVSVVHLLTGQFSSVIKVIKALVLETNVCLIVGATRREPRGG